MLKVSNTEADFKELADQVIIWSKTLWFSDWPPQKMRWLFVRLVLGEHIHCYKCKKCGIKFIANSEAKILKKFYCPSCVSDSNLSADDSFIDYLLGPYKNEEREQ